MTDTQLLDAHATNRRSSFGCVMSWFGCSPTGIRATMRSVGPVGDEQLGAVAAHRDGVRPAAARRRRPGGTGPQVERADRAVVDVERVQRVGPGVEQQAAREPLLLRRRRLELVQLLLGELARVRLVGAGAPELAAFERERVQQAGPAAGPPHLVLAGDERESEPALLDRLLVEDLLRRQVDQRQLVLVVPAGRDEGALAVREREDVQWQVGQRDVLAGRRDGPAVGQQEAGVRRARKDGLALLLRGRGPAGKEDDAVRYQQTDAA
jgi:hypothetical protein